MCLILWYISNGYFFITAWYIHRLQIYLWIYLLDQQMLNITSDLNALFGDRLWVQSMTDCCEYGNNISGSIKVEISWLPEQGLNPCSYVHLCVKDPWSYLHIVNWCTGIISMMPLTAQVPLVMVVTDYMTPSWKCPYAYHCDMLLGVWKYIPNHEIYLKVCS